MASQESSKSEWLFTKRALYRSGAFTINNPIAFLPQQAKNNALHTTSTGELEEPQGLTGDEAKKIYEDIVYSKGQTESSKKTRTSNKLATVIRAKETLTKLRRKSSSHLSSSKNHVKSNPPLSVAKLFLSAQLGDVKTLEQGLMAGCDVNTTDHYNWSLLMTAACAGHLPVVQLLLKYGAKWRDIRDQRGFDAVDLAAMGGHSDIVEILSPSQLPAADSSNNVCSSRKRLHSALDKESSFYCEVCVMEVTESVTDHNLSTVHQFNSQLHSADIPYSIPQSNKGFQLMIKRGWNPVKGLGPCEQGTRQPIKTVLKSDRQGLGSERKQKARVTHFASFDKSAIQCSSKRTRSISRRQDEEMDTPRLSKRARHDALQKDKQWEVDMRRYLSSDDHIY